MKPSTSKLANGIRDAIAAWRAASAEADPAPSALNLDIDVEAAKAAADKLITFTQAQQPAADADVEVWRIYARKLGHDLPELDTLNRSQIRTLLGLPHVDPDA